MASQHIASIAAFAFTLMALSACASTEQVAPAVAADAIETPAEFHDAHISRDALRDRLGGE